MNPQPQQEPSPKLNVKSKLLWSLLFLVIAALTVFAVMAQSKSFSFGEFLTFVANAHPGYLGIAFLCMLGFIFFEGAALYSLCRGFGHRRALGHHCFYSAADIYFSAITPSASGGQPACAYFMIRDGIPGIVVTVALIVNLAMYAISILVLGLITFIASPAVFLSFSPLSKILIILGYLMQIGLSFFFILLVTKKSLLHRICSWGLRVLGKMHLLRRVEERQQKLDRAMADYERYSEMLSGQWRMLVRVFFFNLLQRASQITVTAFTFLATAGDPHRFLDVWCLQSYTVIGSNCVPIPGAMGVSDYLLLDGFGGYLGLSSQSAANLELLSRSLSFYSCIILCGIAVVIKYILQSVRGKKHDRRF